MKITVNAAKPVKYNERAISTALENDSCLIADVKYDSVRCHLVIKPTADINGMPAARAYALSRSNKLIPSLVGLFSCEAYQLQLGQFLNESLYPNGLILDGEIMVKGKNFHDGAGLLRSKKRLYESELTYVLYGVLDLAHFQTLSTDNEPFDVSNVVMLEQLAVIHHQVTELLPALDWQVVESHLVYSMEELQNLYKEVRSRGLEGLVIKRPFAKWHRGKKVGWWKMKPEDTTDGTVITPMWGTEGKANEDKVIGFYVRLENGQCVYVDGLTEAQKQEYTAIVKDNSSFYNGRYVQIKFMERTPSGNLRHPKFDCWRGTETDPTLKS